MSHGDGTLWWRLAGILGALGVALGAFGAHGLEDIVTDETLEWWHTGSRYHLVHAVALGLVGAHPAHPRAAGALFVAGIVLFSGSLYVMTLTESRALAPITPLGGLCLIAGWVALAVAPSPDA